MSKQSSVKRWSAKRKQEVVLRLLRGESLDALSRETGQPAAVLSGWRDEFLEGGVAALKRRTDDPKETTERPQAAWSAKLKSLKTKHLRSVKRGHLASGLTLPGVRIETRMDGAFFSQTIVQRLEALGVDYALSVPFEALWKPKSWACRHRFVFIRKQVKRQCKEPVQIDLFQPFEYGFDFKVILTNKSLTPAKLLAFHNGRGSQESLFAELKSGNAMAYVPTRTWIGNQIYVVAALMAHNLSRELQMRTTQPEWSTAEKRSALWPFASLATIRRRIIQRAGRLIRPQGQLTLSMSANEAVKNELLQSLAALGVAA